MVSTESVVQIVSILDSIAERVTLSLMRPNNLSTHQYSSLFSTGYQKLHDHAVWIDFELIGSIDNAVSQFVCFLSLNKLLSLAGSLIVLDCTEKL